MGEPATDAPSYTHGGRARCGLNAQRRASRWDDAALSADTQILHLGRGGLADSGLAAGGRLAVEVETNSAFRIALTTHVEALAVVANLELVCAFAVRDARDHALLVLTLGARVFGAEVTFTIGSAASEGALARCAVEEQRTLFVTCAANLADVVYTLSRGAGAIALGVALDALGIEANACAKAVGVDRAPGDGRAARLLTGRTTDAAQVVICTGNRLIGGQSRVAGGLVGGTDGGKDLVLTAVHVGAAVHREALLGLNRKVVVVVATAAGNACKALLAVVARGACLTAVATLCRDTGVVVESVRVLYTNLVHTDEASLAVSTSCTALAGAAARGRGHRAICSTERLRGCTAAIDARQRVFAIVALGA